MSYQIITDSCCDLTDEQLKNLQVSCANLTVLYNGENHSNFSDPAAVKAFYDELRTGVMATTAAANPDDWANIMLPALKEGENVIAIHFGGGWYTQKRGRGFGYPKAIWRIVGEDKNGDFDFVSSV